jgi:hypothetical protein
VRDKLLVFMNRVDIFRSNQYVLGHLLSSFLRLQFHIRSLSFLSSVPCFDDADVNINETGGKSRYGGKTISQLSANGRSYFTCIYCEVKQPSRNIKNPVDLLWKGRCQPPSYPFQSEGFSTTHCRSTSTTPSSKSRGHIKRNTELEPVRYWSLNEATGIAN